MSFENRYRDAYLVANSTESIGKLLKDSGLVLGILIVVATLLMSSQFSENIVLLLGAIILAVMIGTFFYVLGTLISAQGQILKASLDNAVNSSPFLTHDQKALVMSMTASTQPSTQLLDSEEEYYVMGKVKVTNKRLIVPPHTWGINQFQPVKVETVGGKYRINLFDKNGKQVVYVDSDSQERIQLVAEAINKAIAQS